MDAAEPVAPADHQHRPVERGRADVRESGRQPCRHHRVGMGWIDRPDRRPLRIVRVPAPTDHEEPIAEHRARGVAEGRREVGDDPNTVRARVDAEHLRSPMHAVGAAATSTWPPMEATAA